MTVRLGYLGYAMAIAVQLFWLTFLVMATVLSLTTFMLLYPVLLAMMWLMEGFRRLYREI